MGFNSGFKGLRKSAALPHMRS